MTATLPFIAAATLLHKVKTAFVINEAAIDGEKPEGLNLTQNHTLVDTDGNVYGLISQQDVDKLLGFDELYEELAANRTWDCTRMTIWLDRFTSANAIVNEANKETLKQKANRFTVSAKPIDVLNIVPLCMLGYTEANLAKALDNLVGSFNYQDAVCHVKVWHLTPNPNDRLAASRPTMITLIDKDSGYGLRYQLVPVVATSGTPAIQFMVIYNQSVDHGGVLFDTIYEAMEFAYNLRDHPASNSKVKTRKAQMVPSLPVVEKPILKTAGKGEKVEFDDDDDEGDY